MYNIYENNGFNKEIIEIENICGIIVIYFLVIFFAN